MNLGQVFYGADLIPRAMPCSSSRRATKPMPAVAAIAARPTPTSTKPVTMSARLPSNSEQVVCQKVAAGNSAIMSTVFPNFPSPTSRKSSWEGPSVNKLHEELWLLHGPDDCG